MPFGNPFEAPKAGEFHKPNLESLLKKSGPQCFRKPAFNGDYSTSTISDTCYKQAAQAYGLNWELLKAQTGAESNYGTNTINSESTAGGPLQVIASIWYRNANIVNIGKSFGHQWYDYRGFYRFLQSDPCFGVWCGAYVLKSSGGQTRRGFAAYRGHVHVASYIASIANHYYNLTGQTLSI